VDEDLDFYEQMALDLDTAQQVRYKKAGFKDEFWTEKEMHIFNQIKGYREYSETFHPLNSR
jgi:hypothetical protein